jgi:uncharacterized protein
MEPLEMTLLFDYYGDLLTERQQSCVDLRYNQDLSLSEIAQELGISRQGVYDTLSRAESLLRSMEEKTGCIRRAARQKAAVSLILDAAARLDTYPDEQVSGLAKEIAQAAKSLEE